MSSESLHIRTADGINFPVDKNTAEVSNFLSRMIEDGLGFDGKAIPLSNVTSSTFKKILQFCQKHAVDTPPSENKMLKDWDAEFLKMEDLSRLFDLMNACNLLEIKDLLELAAERVAFLIKDMRVEEVREVFNIKSDYTKAEEAAIRVQYAWAHEFNQEKKREE